MNHPFFDDNAPSALDNYLHPQAGALDVSGKPVLKAKAHADDRQRMVAVTGQCQGKEVFMMWPLSEFRGAVTHDWKTLKIAMATFDVVVEGENLESIVVDLAANNGIALRPMKSESPKKISISSIEIVPQNPES